MVMALMRFRQGNFVKLEDDDDEERDPDAREVEYY
jgi:hypothetical protein